MKVSQIGLFVARQVTSREVPILVLAAAAAFADAASSSMILHVLTSLGEDSFDKPSEVSSALSSAAGLIGALYLAKAVAHYAHLALLTRASMRIMQCIQLKIIKSAICLEVCRSAPVPVHEMRTLIFRRMHRFRFCCRMLISTVCHDIASVIGLNLVLFLHNWRLALLSVIILPASVATIMVVEQRSRRLHRRSKLRSRSARDTVMNLMEGAGTHSLEGGPGLGEITDVLRRVYNTVRHAENSRFFASALVDWPVGVLLFSTLMYLSVAPEQAKMGSLAGFLLATMMAFSPLRRIARNYVRLGRYGDTIRHISTMLGLSERARRVPRDTAEDLATLG